MKNFVKITFLLIALISSSMTAQTVTVGNIDGTSGDYIITATQSELDGIFSEYSIFDDWNSENYRITYDNITDLYHLEADGVGTGPNRGETASLRVFLAESGGEFSWGPNISGPSNPAAESCSGDPCEHCVFAKGGGCDCENDLEGNCNHSIEKTSTE